MTLVQRIQQSEPGANEEDGTIISTHVLYLCVCVCVLVCACVYLVAEQLSRYHLLLLIVLVYSLL